jgi:hypothetical protein
VQEPEIRAIAGKYGQKVRELEDLNRHDDRRICRGEWLKFKHMLSVSDMVIALDAYYEEYCKE